MANVSIISTVLTGHTHFGSPYESFDNCGTCDGALCHRCEKRFMVTNLKTGKCRYFKTREEAEALVEEWAE